MAELAQNRVRNAIEELVRDIDTSIMRKMQSNMHKCAAQCCDNPSSTMEETHNCIEKCSQNMNEAQNYLQTELGNYQDRIMRCSMDCKDKIADRMTSNTSEAETEKMRLAFEDCLVKCADTNIKAIPLMKMRISDTLKRYTYT